MSRNLVLNTLFVAAVLAGFAPCGSAVSHQGYAYSCVSSAAPWSERSGHAAVVFDDKLWVIGGYHDLPDDERDLNDVWCSRDGISWENTTEAAPWSARFGLSSVVLAGQLWVIGGQGEGFKKDVWRSSDGAHWTLVTTDGGWGDVELESCTSLSNTLWAVCEYVDGTNSQNSVWRSADGHDWTLARSVQPWESRDGLGVIVFQGKMWILGGAHYPRDEISNGMLNDVWWTVDGVNYEQVTENAAWRGRYGHATTVFDDRLWVVGGSYVEGVGSHSWIVTLNDVWHSSDGANWTEQTAEAPWAARTGHAVVEFNGRLWMLGGHTYYPYESLNDVWCLTPVTVSVETHHGAWYRLNDRLALKAVVTGITGETSYQWQKDGAPIPGATDDAYGMDAVDLSDAGAYTCRVTDQYNATFTSDPVPITVITDQLPLRKVSWILPSLFLLGYASAIGVRRTMTASGKAS